MLHVPVILNFLDIIINPRQVNFAYFHYRSDYVSNATSNFTNEFLSSISDSRTIANINDGTIHINQVILYRINLTHSIKLWFYKKNQNWRLL